MKLVIAGGIYREICQFPESREIFGSGGRAAAAVSGVCPGVELHGYVSNERLVEVATGLAAFDLNLVGHSSTQLISFRYLHGLAAPVPEPALNVVTQEPPIHIDADAVLRFGMVEGSAVVSARSAVYDPQAPLNPVRFSANGSTATRLAYVINSSEARQLSGSDDLEGQLTWIHCEEKAEVVVLKQGAHGACVSYAGNRHYIPCFKTEFVWPIGSGDVFSGMFAHYWMIGGLLPEQAARYASLATAHFCNSHSVPVAADFYEVEPTPLKPTARRDGLPLVYLAGPFFTLPQRWLIDSLREALLSMGVSVFSPVHDVGEGDAEQVARADLQGVDRSAVVLAVLDGLDAGTLFEAGYAVAKDIPVVAFTQTETNDNLTMLLGTGCKVERDLVTAVYKAIWIALEAA